MKSFLYTYDDPEKGLVTNGRRTSVQKDKSSTLKGWMRCVFGFFGFVYASFLTIFFLFVSSTCNVYLYPWWNIGGICVWRWRHKNVRKNLSSGRGGLEAVCFISKCGQRCNTFYRAQRFVIRTSEAAHNKTGRQFPLCTTPHSRNNKGSIFNSSIGFRGSSLATRDTFCSKYAQLWNTAQVEFTHIFNWLLRNLLGRTLSFYKFCKLRFNKESTSFRDLPIPRQEKTGSIKDHFVVRMSVCLSV